MRSWGWLGRIAEHTNIRTVVVGGGGGRESWEEQEHSLCVHLFQPNNTVRGKSPLPVLLHACTHPRAQATPNDQAPTKADTFCEAAMDIGTVAGGASAKDRPKPTQDKPLWMAAHRYSACCARLCEAGLVSVSTRAWPPPYCGPSPTEQTARAPRLSLGLPWQSPAGPKGKTCSKSRFFLGPRAFPANFAEDKNVELCECAPDGPDWRRFRTQTEFWPLQMPARPRPGGNFWNRNSLF